MSDDEFYKRVLPTFNRLNAGVGASIVVLMGFLAAVWKQDPQLVNATLDAIWLLGLALIAFAFVVVLESSFAHQLSKPGSEKNHRESIRAFNIFVLAMWVFALVRFYFAVKALTAS